jgi:hypothetical protein
MRPSFPFIDFWALLIVPNSRRTLILQGWSVLNGLNFLYKRTGFFKNL